MNVFTICKKFFPAVSLICLFALNARAQVIFDGNKNIITIGNAIGYYIDSSSSQNIQSIQQQKHFVKNTANVPDFGLLKVPIWLKISINNKSTAQNLMIKFDQSLLLSIEFYYYDHGKYTVNQAGELYPFNSRTINYHKFVYDLKIPPDSTVTYYARIKSSHEMQMPVFLGKKDSIEDDKLAKNILFGVFFGIILVMFFYNLFIYFVVKDTIYLYYVVYIFVVGLVQATIEGYCFQ